MSSLAYLEATTAKQNVALQWMQRLVVENARSGVIDIAPPILSRVFQELSIGIVHFIDANKISTVPFPFVFAQTVWGMLAFASIVPLPLLLAIGLSASKAAAYTFLIVFAFWSVHLSLWRSSCRSATIATTCPSTKSTSASTVFSSGCWTRRPSRHQDSWAPLIHISMWWHSRATFPG